MAPRGRILVVDDSEDVREFYAAVLTEAGYEVAEAEDGAAGFECVRTARPDLIILDVVMPVMDGLELLLKLRSDLAPPVPPVILASGFDITEQEALRRGAARFLPKPIDMADLVGAVEAVLRGQLAAPENVELQRQHARAARQRVLFAAREFVARLESQGLPSLATFEGLAETELSTLAQFLGVSGGVSAVVRDDQLTVAAVVGTTKLARGDDLGPALPEAYAVLETGSSLLLPDASAYPLFSVARTLDGVRLFAGVPLRAEGDVSVGVVCLFDPAARAIDAEDLRALQLFGRRGSDLLVRYAEHGSDARLARHAPGIFSRALFEQLLDTEMRILDRRGGSMEILVVDTPDIGVVSSALQRQTGARQRLLATALSATRAAIFKRASDDSAPAQVGAIVEVLRSMHAANTFGIVDVVDAGVSWLGASTVLNAASEALDRAEAGAGGVRRILIEEHAT